MSLQSVCYFLLAAVMAFSTAVTAAPPVSLDIKYQRGGAPFTTHVRMSVEPHIDNRYLCLQWVQIQGGTNERTSCQSIAPVVKDDGTVVLPPKTHWQFIKDLPSGRWNVVAYVIRNNESGKLSNTITLHVLGPNYESEPVP